MAVLSQMSLHLSFRCDTPCPLCHAVYSMPFNDLVIPVSFNHAKFRLTTLSPTSRLDPYFFLSLFLSLSFSLHNLDEKSNNGSASRPKGAGQSVSRKMKFEFVGS